MKREFLSLMHNLIFKTLFFFNSPLVEKTDTPPTPYSLILNLLQTI